MMAAGDGGDDPSTHHGPHPRILGKGASPQSVARSYPPRHVMKVTKQVWLSRRMTGCYGGVSVEMKYELKVIKKGFDECD